MSVSTTDQDPSSSVFDGDRPVYIPGEGMGDGYTVRANQVVRRSFDEREAEPVPQAVPMPTPGESVYLANGHGGVWLGVSHASPGGYLTAHLLDGERIIEESAPAQGFDSRTVVVGSAVAETRQIVGVLSAAVVARAQEQRADAQWRQTLTEDLHQEADERGFCPMFDDWMERHNLARRERDYRVRLSVDVSVTVEVRATSAEEAEGMVTTDRIVQAFDAYAIDDWSVTDTEAE